mmetsp:Transcript_52439/g.119361  ORF Transcript_52439/g.119361 Transcript_52439/m.119361 type:complete len:102 (-) Transcript_52439:27-332(-)
MLGRSFFTKSGHFGWINPEVEDKKPVLIKATSLSVSRPLQKEMTKLMASSPSEELAGSKVLCDLLTRFLKYAPSERPRPTEALRHRFFGSEGTDLGGPEGQ